MSSIPTMADSNLIPADFPVPAGMGPTVEPTTHLPPALTNAPTVAGLAQALRRRWPLALGLALVAAMMAVVGVFTLMPAKYPAQVRLHIASRGDVRVFG